MYISPGTRSAIRFVIGLIFLVIFAGWEWLNFWTSETGLNMMMGYREGQVIAWIRLFALAIVGMDVLHLAVFFLDRLVPEVMPDEVHTLSWVAWGIVTLGDVVLSWYTLGLQYETGLAQRAVQAPAAIQDFLMWGPIVLSFVMWGMAFFAITVGRALIASALGLGGFKPPKPHVQPVQPHQPNKGHQKPTHQQPTIHPVGKPADRSKQPQPYRPTPRPGFDKLNPSPAPDKQLDAFVKALEDELGNLDG